MLTIKNSNKIMYHVRLELFAAATWNLRRQDRNAYSIFGYSHADCIRAQFTTFASELPFFAASNVA